MSAEHVPASLGLSRATNAKFAMVSAAIVELTEAVRLIAKAVGAELPEEGDSEALKWARRSAVAADEQESVNKVVQQMADARKAADRQSGLPSHDAWGDGTRAPAIAPGDDWERERADFIQAHRFSQAAHHAKLAKAGSAPWDASDAHRDTRKIREQIYSRLKTDGRG